MNQRTLLNKIKEEVRNLFPGAKIILYGSRARGNAKKDSDWDILVLLPKKNITFDDESRIISSIYDIELESGEVISTLIYPQNDWETKHFITPLYKNIKREGIKFA